MHLSLYHRRAASRLGTALSALLLLVVTLGAADPAPAPFESRIDQIVQNGAISDAFWGIDIRDVETGRQIYGRNSSSLLMPASTNKLITSATALDALGHDYRYRTTLYYDGEVTSDGVLRGDLIVVGSGDPTFGSTAMDEESTPLRNWAQELAQMGITRIEGRIIGNDDVFSDNPYAEGWDVDYLTRQASSWLGISTSGLSYNDNTIRVQVSAGRTGSEPRVRMQPTGYLNIRNEATTRNVSRGAAVELHRDMSSLNSETFVVEGWVSRRWAGTFERPVHNPTLLTVHAFRQLLLQTGIEVAASVHDADNLPEKPNVEEDAEPLLVHFSTPLLEILRMTNHESNNFYAEQIFRSFSPNGSLDGSENRVKALLRRAGADPAGLSIRDGSGLSRKDLVTPAALTQLLAYMNTHPEGAAFRSTIARGGAPNSTLRYRLRGLPVQAKTGSLSYVRALSGYATLSDGRTVSFALLANNYKTRGYQITQAMDRIVQAMTSIPIG